ncbi:hypothetical protein HMPREF1486_00651 [Streptomyces sp. HPH0547]|nr:hypothetical protein HMPREF1486_00651 [Streptomyces sp. HPH0547]
MTRAGDRVAVREWAVREWYVAEERKKRKSKRGAVP